jgi:hypothetical protein
VMQYRPKLSHESGGALVRCCTRSLRLTLQGYESRDKGGAPADNVISDQVSFEAGVSVRRCESKRGTAPSAVVEWVQVCKQCVKSHCVCMLDALKHMMAARTCSSPHDHCKPHELQYDTGRGARCCSKWRPSAVEDLCHNVSSTR